MLNPLVSLLSTIFAGAKGLVDLKAPEKMLGYGDLLPPVAHIEPPEPIYGVGGLADYGWTTLANIMRNAPDVKNSLYQDHYSRRQIKHVADVIIGIAHDIEHMPVADFSIPLSRLSTLEENSKFIHAIADTYYQTGTTLRLQKPADNADMTNVRDVFSGSAALADKAAGRVACYILKDFITGVNKVCHEAIHDIPFRHSALLEDPSWNKGPPSPLKNRMPRRD